MSKNKGKGKGKGKGKASGFVNLPTPPPAWFEGATTIRGGGGTWYFAPRNPLLPTPDPYNRGDRFGWHGDSGMGSTDPNKPR